eukprot:365315-Chlamydomonas_euryale.AAC.13
MPRRDCSYHASVHTHATEGLLVPCERAHACHRGTARTMRACTRMPQRDLHVPRGHARDTAWSTRCFAGVQTMPRIRLVCMRTCRKRADGRTDGLVVPG